MMVVGYRLHLRRLILIEFRQDAGERDEKLPVLNELL
jgi:hypothetical protein